MSNVHAIKVKAAVSHIDVGNIRVYSEFMETSVFEGLPRNTKQRNEALRSAPHLANLQPEHVVVAVLRDQDGNDTKIDGHTRIYMKKQGELNLPTHLLVIVYHIIDRSLPSKDEEIRLYDSYDSRSASKKANDEIQGAMNQFGIEYSTPWLAKGGYSNMLAVASSFIRSAPQGNTAKAKSERVKFFRPELTLLDSITPRTDKITSGFGAGVIMFLRHFGKDGLPIVASYNAGTGSVEIDGKRNALSRLQKLLGEERAARRMAGDENNKRQARECYELLELARRNSDVNGRINTFDPVSFAAAVK